jgi:DNA-binding HxlR family transcriptional regulator
VLHNTYEGQNCSVARALELVGERWTILILRDAFLGVRRFDDFQRRLGVARNVLNTRLQRLVDNGILERRLYQERPRRYEYRLTEMGRGLWPAVVALMQWGDRWLAGEQGPPMAIEHRDCGGAVDERRMCTRCGERLELRDVRAVPGPAAYERELAAG